MIDFLPGGKKIDDNEESRIENATCCCIGNFLCQRSYEGLQGYTDGTSASEELKMID